MKGKIRPCRGYCRKILSSVPLYTEINFQSSSKNNMPGSNSPTQFRVGSKIKQKRFK